MRRSVGIFVALAALQSLALGVLTVKQERDSKRLTDRLLAEVKLVRASVMADMFHETVRSDVLAAQLAGPQASAREREAIGFGLAGHREAMIQWIAKVQLDALDEQVSAAAAAAETAAQAYLRAAEEAVQAGLAGAGTAAQARADSIATSSSWKVNSRRSRS